MELRITPTNATLGAIVTDLDLRRLDDSNWTAIEDAFHRFAVLVFPRQKLDANEQADFAERFGDIMFLTPDEKLKSVPLTNVNADGSIMGEEVEFTRILRGNEGWHTDSSYMPLAAKASVLSAHVLPTEGTRTEWADMRDAYDSLDGEMQKRIAGLSAHHSLYYSQAKIGHDAKAGSSYGFHSQGAPLRPLVKVHPVTGRKSLFIGRHAYGIPGLPEEESESLLSGLLDAACRPPRVFGHDWAVGDLVIWDNRCVLHRARPYDYREARVVVHTRIAGNPTTELAPTSALPG